MSEFKMPMLGADMEAGTLVQWLKHPGDPLKRGDIIAVVDTEKGAIEIEVFESGILDKALVQPGEKVPVGTVLAFIRKDTEKAAPSTVPVEAPRVRASPVARQLAQSLGVDLARVHGTGPDGAITRGDVERSAAARAQAPAATPALHAGMRTAIAAAMSRAKRDIPHYYLSTSIDMAAATRWLRTYNEQHAVAERLLMIALLVKAVALALREVPELNGYWIDGAFKAASDIHIGCAIALRGGGLIAPAIHETDRKDLATLMRDIGDLVTRARSGSLRSSELSDATLTVTNLGEQGVDSAFGIIYPPQVALVGFGRIQDRPWVVSGSIEPRPSLTATLSADHRASDGHRGGLFLAAIDRWLQKPAQL
jgi:pyruvate dehydrogenase E2 component (dihydrolipoamide acetyltransferase)